jgi:hypothetical protein
MPWIGRITVSTVVSGVDTTGVAVVDGLFDKVRLKACFADSRKICRGRL